MLSALVLVVTATGWSLYRDLVAGLTTTDVIFGSSSGNGLNILLVGVDSRTDAQGNPLPDDVVRTLHSGPDTGVLNSDTIILLHLPARGGSAIAFSIPRDTYVDIPGHRKDKINAAYPAMKARTAEELAEKGGKDPREIDRESSAAGRSALIATVQNLTGTHIDHYAEINLLGFYNLTTAIGGVEVCLNAPVDDELSGARFPAGRQTISGAAALSFVRQRHGLPEGDLSRIRRQQVFLAAVADKILSAGTLTNPAALGRLIDVVHKSLVIDSGWDLLTFAQRAAGIAAGRIEFATIPTHGGESNARGDVVLVDPAQVREAIARQTAAAAEASDDAPAPAPAPAPASGPGPTPARPAGTPTGGPPSTVDPASVTVDVSNASGATGLAGHVADRLSAAGYHRGTVQNAAHRTTSVVSYAGDDAEPAARAVAAMLGGLAVERAPEAGPGTAVQVVLGGDFPAAHPAPGSTATAAPDGSGPTINAGGVPCID
ncbi:LCP family protein [Pseudonocardia asaccharolytica]|uniref:LCP family protein n=1 Tax=Pseudonocardia asaccharolytica TaxID=54010 RepID=UPI001FDEB35E|nr:LCP family protein [Pseudonocardia asaccharolytica]